MRFDPQADFVSVDQGLLPGTDGYLDAPRINSPLRTALVILIIGFLSGVGVWMWSENPVGRAEASPEPPASSAEGSAVVQYAEALSTAARAGPSDGRAETGNQPRMRVNRNGQIRLRDVSGIREAYEAGRSYMAMGRYGQAVPFLAEAVRLDPDFADGHYRLGLAYVQTGDLDAARSEVDVLEKIDPNLANLLGHLIR